MKLRPTFLISILLVMFLFGFDSARAQASEPWKNYVGAVQGSFPWGTTNRNGFMQTTDGHINADAVNQVLQTHDLIFGQNDGLGSARDPVRVSAFMNGIRADKGAAWKAEVLTEANEMIAAHKGKAHKVYWQLGNEVSAETFSETIRAWAGTAGLPYPSPYTPFNDPQTPNDRGYIGYYIEYDVAPAIESLIAANAAAAPEDRIVIMTGSLANAAGSAARNSWLPAMLNYVIRGDYAPSLAGKTVASLVEVITIHYTGGQQAVIDSLFDTWVTPGAAIKGVWATEEIGIRAADGGRGGSVALRVFARYLDVWMRRGLTSRQARLTYYAPRTSGPNPNTSGDYALTRLDAFMPSATTSLTSKAGLVTTDSSTTVETYTFENQTRDKRVVFVFPTATQGASGSLQQIRVKADGWTGAVTGTLNLFSTEGHRELAVTINKEQDSYVISTATPVSWANDALAVLFLNAGAAPRAVTSVSAASFAGSTLAAEAIVSAFGANLATATQSATVSPLPTTLAGTTVKIRDGAGTERLSPLFFVSPTQINYQIPAATATGSATITVTSGDGSVSTGATLISTVAPGLFTANASGQGVAAAIALRIKADGSQSFEPIAQFDAAQGKVVDIPIDLGPDTDQVFLLLFGTGIRYRSSLSAVSAKIGGADGQVTFAGAQGGFVGLDQVNVRLSRNLIGRGDVDIALTVDAQAANTVKVTLK